MPKDLALAGRRVTVLGAGRTGQASARFLAKHHAKVFVSEQSHISLAVKRAFSALGISHEEGGHSEKALQQVEFIIPSPGVRYDAPVLIEARARGIPIIGELELASLFCRSKRIIAITGTVGKTTTTHLAAELLKAHDYPVIVAGNIGQPLIAHLHEINSETVVVLEVSSYQLEHVESFRPHIGVFTRFAPHHLDRHGSLERYFAMKCRLFAQQTEEDHAVVHRDIALPPTIRSRVWKFSAEELGSHRLAIHVHQQEDLAAALKTGRLIDPQISHESLDLNRVLELPHRLEYVAEVNGVRFYNDSKATSSAATLAALSTFDEPVALILGGYDEGDNIRELAQTIRDREIHAVLLMGQTRKRWAHMLKALGYRRFQVVEDLDHAIHQVMLLGPRICLFSPASPSFDQFKNYEERGEHFKRVVRSYLLQTAITHPSDQLAIAS